VKGIAFMEAIVWPQGWDHWDKINMRPALQALRSEAALIWRQMTKIAHRRISRLATA